MSADWQKVGLTLAWWTEWLPADVAAAIWQTFHHLGPRPCKHINQSEASILLKVWQVNQVQSVASVSIQLDIAEVWWYTNQIYWYLILVSWYTEKQNNSAWPVRNHGWWVGAYPYSVIQSARAILIESEVLLQWTHYTVSGTPCSLSRGKTTLSENSICLKIHFSWYQWWFFHTGVTVFVFWVYL